jgi:hypothetical protein
MAYIKPPVAILPGIALNTVPAPPVDNIPVVLDCDIATTTDLGVVKVGLGLSVAPDGTISSTGGSGITGTWAPMLAASDSTIVPVTIANARYSKIGQYVFCTFDVTVTSLGSTSASATLSLKGLPAVSAADPGYVGSGYVAYFSTMDSNVDYFGGTVSGTSTVAALWFTSEQKKTVVALTRDDIKAGTRIAGTIQYISAA